MGTALRGDAANTAVTYQINPQHSGVQMDSTLVPPFGVRWEVTLSGFLSYPLIADGMVFVTAVGGSLSRPTLYALDQVSGHTVWAQQLPGGVSYPRITAAYDNSRIFTIDASGVLTAFNAANGAILWSETLPLQNSFTSAPTAANGIVYVSGSGSSGTVYAVDEQTGAVLATRPVQNGDQSSPALSQTSVFVSYACNQAYAFAIGTLTPLWHHNGPCEGGGGKNTVYENGRLFTRDFTGNLILDASTGNSLGTYNASAIPAVLGNMMWVLNGSTLSAQNISNPASPNTLWTFSGDGHLVTAPIVISTGTENLVVEVSAYGGIYVLDGATGSLRFSGNLGIGVQGPDEQNVGPFPALAAGHGMLVIPAGPTLVALGPGNGIALAPALSPIALIALAMCLAVVGLIAVKTR